MLSALQDTANGASDAAAGGAIGVVTGNVTRPEPEQFEPFPLLDLQQAYWIGRMNGPLGSIACHGYLELDVDRIDVDRLDDACNRLVARHPMLRAVVAADGTQRVLRDVPRFRVDVVDVPPGREESSLHRVREEMSHQVLPADTWPLFQVRVSRRSADRARLHISFDILIADALSFRILALELAELYEDPGRELPPVGLTFRDYVMLTAGRRDEAARQQAWEYWRSVLDALPPAPDLPLATRLEELAAPRFTRFETRIDSETWSAVRRLAGNANVPTVLAAFAETIGMWSAAAAFTLNLTVFDRQPVHPDVHRVVGPFTGISLLGVDLECAGSFRDLVAQLQRRVWEGLEHRAVNGVEVLRELARRGGGGASMPIVFTYVQDPGNDDFRAGLRRLGEVGFAISQTPQVLIDCQVAEQGDELLLWWDAVADAFPPGMVAEMFAAFAELVRALARDETWSRGHPVATPAAAVAVRRATQSSAALALRPLHEMVLSSADRRPDATAVIGEEVSVSYAQLATTIQAIAGRLRAVGVRPGELVAVHAARDWRQVAAVAGVVAAGAAYLPLDVSLPQRRLSQLAHATGLRVLVTDGAGDRLAWFAGEHVVHLDTDPPSPPPAAANHDRAELDDLAYVIFTSGSTGVPKGVSVRHRAAATTILDVNARWRIGPGDRVLAVSSLGFDLSVWDIFGLLAAGGTVVTAGPGERAKDPAEWLERIARHRITVWNSVPALMGLLVDLCELRGVTLPSLRLVLLSGDWIPVSLPDRIRRVAPGAAVVSLGGATEAAIWSVAYETTEEGPGWPSVPYGYPLTNQQLYVLDWAGRERPCHVPGELYIGGDGLASGYWGADELTAGAFGVHPELGQLYRTGDMVRRHPDGVLEFLGRRDGQVKVQGHRIELGEVEAALLALPGVRAVVADVVGPRDGQRQLVAYVVPAPGTDTGDIRGALAERLPPYLVPARVVAVPELPLTGNGKVDRARLPEVDPAPAQGAAAAPPGDGGAGHPPSPFEEYLLEWARTWLGSAAVSSTDDLVAAGMDSLDLVRLCNVMERDLDFRPPHEDLVRSPTVAAVRHMLEADLLRRLRSGHRLVAGDRPAPGPAESDGRGRRQADERRELLSSLPGLDLPPVAPPDRAEPLAGRGRPWFGDGFVAPDQIGALLATLGSPLEGNAADDAPRVLTFLHVRPERVAGLDGGVLFYNPVAHRLAPVAAVDLESAWFEAGTDALAGRQAAFAIYLVADVDGRGSSAAAFEAGAMATLLRGRAADLRLCLCPADLRDDGAVSAAVGADVARPVLAALLGGPVPDPHDGYEEGEI